MSKRLSDDFSNRIRLVGILLFLIAAGILYRLVDLQIIKADYYRVLANRQYAASQIKSPIEGRGVVYFRQKNEQLVSAADIRTGYKLVINPSSVKNPEEVYDKIFSVLSSIDKNEFLRKVKKEDDAYEEIAYRLDPSSAEDIKKLAIEGVVAVPENWRFYPGGKLASHVLGFVGYTEKGIGGQYGIEKFYEEKLKGSGDGINFFTDVFLGLSREIFLSSLENKEDVILTIEPSVQGFLETSLEKIMSEYSAEGAGGIIMNPKTGKILAMAAKPDFDPNFYNKVENHAVFLNPIVSSIFEMGSVMKPITLASALDSGRIRPETTYYDNGYLVIDQARIENYDKEGRGKATMQMVLNKSLNTGAVFAMRQLGKDNFRDYFKAFGFGEKTGIELPDEIGGDITSLNSPREVEYATASFGQGIAPTPLGFATAFSALANGGGLVQPYIVETDELKPVVRRQVIKKETSEEITGMLVKVVDEALLEGTVKIEHYSVAAKTGTAQMPFEDQKGYSDDYLHTFIGYVPAYDAKFLTFLYLKKPVGVKYASGSLTPAFMDITKFLLNYYEIAPDR